MKWWYGYKSGELVVHFFIPTCTANSSFIRFCEFPILDTQHDTWFYDFNVCMKHNSLYNEYDNTGTYETFQNISNIATFVK